jgi:hypothetical protein
MCCGGSFGPSYAGERRRRMVQVDEAYLQELERRLAAYEQRAGVDITPHAVTVSGEAGQARVVPADGDL